MVLGVLRIQFAFDILFPHVRSAFVAIYSYTLVFAYSQVESERYIWC